MQKLYYIWGPKYIGGELNGPDLVAGVILNNETRLVFRGRAPELMLAGLDIEDAKELEGPDAEILFHKIVDQSVPESMQLVFDNASKRESADFFNPRRLPNGSND